MTLKSLRKERKVSQAALASAVGVTQQSVYQYEAGIAKPTPDVAIRISEFFGLSIEQMWQLFYERGQAIESP